MAYGPGGGGARRPAARPTCGTIEDLKGLYLGAGPGDQPPDAQEIGQVFKRRTCALSLGEITVWWSSRTQQHLSKAAIKASAKIRISIGSFQFRIRSSFFASVPVHRLIAFVPRPIEAN